MLLARRECQSARAHASPASGADTMFSKPISSRAIVAGTTIGLVAVVSCAVTWAVAAWWYQPASKHQPSADIRDGLMGLIGAETERALVLFEILLIITVC